MNEHEIQRIAAAMNALRPDWPTNSLRTLIRNKLGDRARRDVTVALAWVACESATASPARVLEAGPWWKATVSDETHGRRDYSVPCSEHAGETLPCRRCTHERVPADNANAAQLARQALAKARAALCPHGVKRSLVRCAFCETPARTSSAESPGTTEPTEETAQ